MKIIVNHPKVSVDGKHLLKGEVHEVKELLANNLIKRKLADKVEEEKPKRKPRAKKPKETIVEE